MAHLELGRVKRSDFKSAIEEGIEAARSIPEKVSKELRNVGENASVIAFGSFWEVAFRNGGKDPQDKIECGCPMSEAGLATYHGGGVLTEKAIELGLDNNTMNDFTNAFDSEALTLLDNAVEEARLRGVYSTDLDSSNIMRIVEDA